eukprot:6174740-Pleurochrysis_carterae.AAC.1
MVYVLYYTEVAMDAPLPSQTTQKVLLRYTNRVPNKLHCVVKLQPPLFAHFPEQASTSLALCAVWGAVTLPQDSGVGLGELKIFSPFALDAGTGWTKCMRLRWRRQASRLGGGAEGTLIGLGRGDKEGGRLCARRGG